MTRLTRKTGGLMTSAQERKVLITPRSKPCRKSVTKTLTKTIVNISFRNFLDNIIPVTVNGFITNTPVFTSVTTTFLTISTRIMFLCLESKQNSLAENNTLWLKTRKCYLKESHRIKQFLYLLQ